MDQLAQDPNRFATGHDATNMRACLEHEQVALDGLERERERARIAVDDATARVEECEAQLLHLQSLRREAMRHARDIVRKTEAQGAVVAAYHGFFNPVRKMPLELLGNIFAYCLVHPDIDVAAPDFAGYSVRYRQSVAFRLAGVCRRWRLASLATPRAWSYLELCFDLIEEDNESQWDEYLSMVLQRSGVAPISIRVSRNHRRHDGNGPFVQRLLPAMRRCTAVDVYVSSLATDDALLPLLTASAPTLLHADLYLDTNASDSGLEDVSIFPDSAQLLSLRSHALFRECASTFPSVQTVMLSYPISYPGRDDLRHLLRTSPNLSYLYFEYPIVDDLEDTSIQPLALPNVRRVELKVDKPTPLAEAFQSVSFPNLERITLHSEARWDGTGACRVAFLADVVRSSPHITTLDLFSIHAEVQPALLAVLSEMRKLATLRMLECTFDADGWRLFVDAFSAAPWRCPVLQEVSFGGSLFKRKCDWDDMIRFVRSRMRASTDRDGPARFSRVSVGDWFEDEHEDEDLQAEIDKLLGTADNDQSRSHEESEQATIAAQPVTA